MSVIDGPGPQKGFAHPKRASTILDAEPLHCRYVLDLQYLQNKSLNASFVPGGSCRYRTCGVRLDIRSVDFYEINERVPRVVADGRYEYKVIEEREFHLGQRFVVKCYARGEFA